MAQEKYDLILDVNKHVNEPYNKYYQQAKAASESGKRKLVSEIILEPYNGKGFKLEKGQVVRYEMISGAQIIDTFYMIRSRPMEEWADTFHTSSFGSHTQWEGDHYYSNSPWCRPLLTLIRDTVDNENLKKLYGEGAAHSDLSMLKNEWGLTQFPLVPGHEVIGKVSAVGEHVAATPT